MSAREVIARIAARADAATRGPWWAAEVQDGTDDGPENASAVTGVVLAPSAPKDVAAGADDAEELGSMWPDANAAFTAAARTDVPRLAAALAAVLDLHHGPRTSRHGSGCVQCGLVWPCPTVRAITDALEETRG